MLPTGLGGNGSSLGTNHNLYLNGGTLRFGLNNLLAVTNPVAGSVTLAGGTLQATNLINQGHIVNVGNTSTLNAEVVNQAYVDVTGGKLVVIGHLFNDNLGTITNQANLQVGATGLGWMTNAGQVVLAGGTITAGMITNSGTISGRGTLASAVDNSSGWITATNGTLSIAGAATGGGNYQAAPGATLSFSGGGSLSSLFNTGATIQVTAGILTNFMIGFDNTGGTLALAGGSYVHASGLFTNSSSGWLTGYGSLTAAAAILNQGTILANGGLSRPLVLNSNLVNTATGYVTASGSALQINGVFTNNGTLQVISGVGTYNNQVVNDNVWRTDGVANNTFLDTFLITTNGYVRAGGSDRYVFKADLLNQSTNNVFWSTLGVTPGTNTVGGGTQFLFSGSGQTHTQLFEHPGLLLTGGFTTLDGSLTTGVQNVSGTIAGFVDNFAVGELVLNNTTLELAAAGATAGITNALFVNDLFLYGAHLVISNDMQVYFVNSNTWNLADITLLGNAQIHQLAGFNTSLIIPEPNVLVMWLCGGVTLWAARRRRRIQQQQT